ncbi:TPA: HNH endonuclease [Vibrio vulnificus]
MNNKVEAQLVESAKLSLIKIIAESNISKFIKFSQIPSKISGSKVAPNYIDAYGCVKFGSSDNPWNMLGINVFVKKGNSDKKDRSNPRKIQFRLIADYSKEAKDKGAKFALMEEVCRRSNNKASIASGKKHGVYCLESDAIEVANCITEIMAEGDKQYFADYDENDKETKSRVFVNHDEFLNEAFSADTANKNVIGVLEPEKETVSVTLYKRDPLVVAETLRLANGYCELCEVKSPFKTKSGRDYLEVHHVIPLSKQGSDTVSNTVALCPNCHRMLHYGDNSEEMMAKLNKIRRLDCFQ